MTSCLVPILFPFPIPIRIRFCWISVRNPKNENRFTDNGHDRLNAKLNKYRKKKLYESLNLLINVNGFIAFIAFTQKYIYLLRFIGRL